MSEKTGTALELLAIGALTTLVRIVGQLMILAITALFALGRLFQYERIGIYSSFGEDPAGSMAWAAATVGCLAFDQGASRTETTSDRQPAAV